MSTEVVTKSKFKKGDKVTHKNYGDVVFKVTGEAKETTGLYMEHEWAYPVVVVDSATDSWVHKGTVVESLWESYLSPVKVVPTRWQDAEPGVERANLVKAPYVLPTNASKGVHYDYIRTPHYESGVPSCLVFATDFNPDVEEFEDEGTYAMEFVHNDDRPFSRVISATRAETAVETQTFLDICQSEFLVAALGTPSAGWCVMDAGDFVDTMDFGRKGGELCGTTLDNPNSLREAYLSYHARKDARGQKSEDV